MSLAYVLLSFLWWRRRHDRFIPFAFFCSDVFDGRRPLGPAILHGVCDGRRILGNAYKPADETLSRVRLRVQAGCGKQQAVDRSCQARGRLHYHPALPQSRRVLRKDCSKFCVNRYAHFKRRFSKVYDRFFRGRDSIVEQGESPFSLPLIESFYPGSEGTMVKPAKASGKILHFATPEVSPEGELEKWFRGV